MASRANLVLFIPQVYYCGMFTKVTNSGGHRYLQIVEGYRTDEGKVRHRVVANLGRMEDLTSKKFDPLINGVNRALGRAENTSSEIVQEFGQSYGNVFALHGLWLELGINKVLNRALRSSRRDFDTEALIRVMVFYRLCVPDSKLDCLRWLETVAMPAIPGTITHQHLLQAMVALMDHLDVIEESFAR